jgi:hypothetical protein
VQVVKVVGVHIVYAHSLTTFALRKTP